MAVSNSCVTGTLKFHDAVGVLSKDVCRKSSGSTETSGSALSVDRRGRSTNREKMASPNPNQGEEIPSRGMSGVGDVVRRDIFRGTASRKKTKKAKVKRRIPCMSRRVTDPMF